MEQCSAAVSSDKQYKLKSGVLYENEDDIFGSEESLFPQFITLSHINNKSSVLCPKSQDITSQYLVLQQLDAHQRMIARAKGCVDTSAPKSYQSYRSILDRKKKKLWQQLHLESKSSSMNSLKADHAVPCSSRKEHLSEKEENESLNASSVSKAVQTGIPFATFSSKVADKISWYLEALNQGVLQSEPYVLDNSSYYSMNSNSGRHNASLKKRLVKGDIMAWHAKHFIQPKKPFSPRILAEKMAKSKVKGMRCYNPPSRKKKSNNSQSSDTFESYDEDEDSDEIQSKNNIGKNSDLSSHEEEADEIERMNGNGTYDFHPTLNTVFHHNEKHYCKSSASELNGNEEERYLDLLSKVTEDILRSGVYTDRAIQHAFEFHMPFYQNETNKEKLQTLLEQILEGLKISSEDLEIPLSLKTTCTDYSFDKLNTPPEKETADTLLHRSEIFCKNIDLHTLSTNENTNDFLSWTKLTESTAVVESSANNDVDVTSEMNKS